MRPPIVAGAAFPEAAGAKSVSDEAFLNALWLSRIGLSFTGDSPTATWDFHALPKGKDDTIFVIRTTLRGQLLDVTTES